MAVLPPLSHSIDPDLHFAQLVESVTQAVTQSLKIYIDQRMQAQEFAIQAGQSTLERRILEKIEDDNSFLLGEMQSQKQSIGALRSSVEHVSTEVTKLAE
jgi:hypothetical protein